MAKYVLRGESPLTIVLRKGKSETAPLRLVPGSGEISDDQAKEIAKLEVVKAMVEEGTLRLPSLKAMEDIWSKRKKRLAERMERLSAVQDERRDQAVENAADASELADTKAKLENVERENEGLRSQLESVSTRLDKLEKS